MNATDAVNATDAPKCPKCGAPLGQGRVEVGRDQQPVRQMWVCPQCDYYAWRPYQEAKP